jgi:tol-pal system protein YbgF
VSSSGQRFALLLALGVAGGCATQADIQLVRDEAQAARRQAADAKSIVEGVRIDLQTLRGEVEAMKVQGGGGAKLSELQSRLDSLDSRIAALQAPPPSAGATGMPATTGGEMPPATGALPPPAVMGDNPIASAQVPAGAPAEFRDAVETLRRGDNQGAIQKFREFLRKAPKSDYADDAQYWIGEAYFASKDYNRAILEFNEVLLRYPKGDKVPAALLRQALAFAELGDKVDARLVLQKLVSEHGDAPEAERGRQKLAELSG